MNSKVRDGAGGTIVIPPFEAAAAVTAPTEGGVTAAPGGTAPDAVCVDSR